MDSINTQMRWKEEKKVRLMASLLLLCSSWVSAAQCKVVEGFGGCQSWTSSWHLWTACCPQVSCTRKHTTDYKCAHTHTKNPDTCMLELNKAHKHTRNKTCTNTQRKQPHTNTHWGWKTVVQKELWNLVSIKPDTRYQSSLRQESHYCQSASHRLPSLTITKTLWGMNKQSTVIITTMRMRAQVVDKLIRHRHTHTRQTVWRTCALRDSIISLASDETCAQSAVSCTCNTWSWI